MKISFVLANQVQLDPDIDLQRVKEIGSFWGGWRTWRSCGTDNVICYDSAKAHQLLQRNFHTKCNFYIPNLVYLNLNRPSGVNLFDGDFKHDVDNHEDIVCMHLAAANSDIVLLLGYDFAEQAKLSDKLAEHKAHNYRSLTRQVMVSNAQVQWVALDHDQDFRNDLKDLPNLGKDTLQNILGS
jgi:hypothetical protein